MAVVSRTSIKSLIEKGDIVVYPQSPDKIGNCSIDVRLGEYFFRQTKPTGPLYPYADGRDENHQPLLDKDVFSSIFDKYSINDKEVDQQFEIYKEEHQSSPAIHPWDSEPQRAVNAEQLKHLGSGIAQNIPLIVIKPGETILATTEEFIGSRLECTTMAKTKSSLARIGLDCFGSSGWGDIGYVNRWAFPLHNKSNRIILLRPGTWVAQIVFMKVSDPEISYTQGGNYQATDDFERLVKEWKPQHILPKHLTCNPV